MKKTILTAAIAIIGLAITTVTTRAFAETTTDIATNQPIAEIEVHGNVLVYLTTGTADKVTTYNNYYADNALVQEENGVLRIASYANEQLTVWVKVTNLSKISAFDNAKVNSFGKLSGIDLKVNLFNKATAQLDVNAFNLACNVHDNAQASVSGDAENSAFQYGDTASVNIAGFNAANLTKTMRHYRSKFAHQHNGNQDNLNNLEIIAERSVS